MSVLNRVWDTQAGPGFVAWRTNNPDPGGAFYPGPGTWATHTSDYCVEGSRAEQDITRPISPTLTVPVGTVQGLWDFDGDLTDQSGNAITLTASGLTPYYGPSPVPGESSFIKTSTGQLQAAVDAALIIHGAITCELMFKPRDIVSASGYGFLCLPTAAGGATANIPWGFLVVSGTNEWVYYHEYASGGASFHQVNSGHFLTPGRWHHLTITKDTAGTLIRLYVNGRLAKREVVANASAGGSAAPLKLGDDGGSVRIDGDFGWLRVTDGEFRPEDVLASARATLPPDMRP